MKRFSLYDIFKTFFLNHHLQNGRKKGTMYVKTNKKTPVVRANSLLEQVKGPHVGQILISWMSEVHLFKKMSQIIFIAVFSSNKTSYQHNSLYKASLIHLKEHSTTFLRWLELSQSKANRNCASSVQKHN